MTDSVFSRQYSRRSMLKAGLYGVAGLAAAPAILEACASTSTSTSSPGGGKIVMGTFTDNAMTPIRDVFNKRFTAETGIQVQYNETSYDAWYQASKNDGLQKTGAYDIYVMDDNWVPEFAAGNVIQSLDKLGFKSIPTSLPTDSTRGTGRRRSGRR